MARPHKQTVAYFPHDTDACEGKTLTIIQSKYGNDGYAFWFKLLQLLGKASGHYYDFNNPADWEFLLAKTHQDNTERTKDILETLVVLGAIDAELYSHGVIWCQKFVDRVADAYTRTVDGVPQRPDFLVNVENKEVSVTHSGQSVDSNPEKATEIPQTKLKETKLKETKLKETKEERPSLRTQEIEFNEFIEELRPQYPDLNFDNELQKFRLYWSEGGRKLKRPKLALKNWMDKAREFKQERSKGGAHKQGSRDLKARGAYRTPDEHRAIGS